MSALQSGKSPVMCREARLLDSFVLGLWYGIRVGLDTTDVVLTALQVIATRTFYVLVLRFDDKHYMTWLVLVAQWSFVGALVIAGPATARTDKHGPFCEQP
jgi:hypothetical protein